MSTSHSLGRIYKEDPRDKLYQLRSLLPAETELTERYWGYKKVLDQDGYPACFPGNTKVLMEDFTYKEISKILQNEVVFTHKGRKGKVLQIFKRKWQGTTTKIKVWGISDIIEATNEHPILTERGWIAAKDLMVEDYVAIPTFNSYVVDKTIYECEKDKEFLWILGLYIAEGYSSDYSINFCLHIKETYLSDKIRNFANKYGLEISEDKNESSNSMYVSIYKKEFSKIFDELAGKYCDKKKLNPRLMFLSPELQLEILKGWEAGDGHISKRGNHSICTTSEKLVWQMYHILLRNGIRATIQKRKERKDRKPVWVIEYHKENTHTSHFNLDKSILFVKIKKVEEKRYYGGGHVYNLEIQNDNSYIVNSVAVHNCVGYGWASWVDDEPTCHPTFIDPMWIYNEAQKIDGIPVPHDGSTVRAGAKVLQKLGLISNYYWASSIDDIVMTLLTLGPVTVGTNWYSGMNVPDLNGLIKPTGRIEGGHCFLLNGIDKKSGLIRMKNSWGTLWGKGGFAFISIKDIESLFKEQGEVCLATEVSGPIPAPQPEPSLWQRFIDWLFSLFNA